jgi:hypothetical protein
MLLKSLAAAFFAKVGVEGSNPFARSIFQNDPTRTLSTGCAWSRVVRLGV